MSSESAFLGPSFTATDFIEREKMKSKFVALAGTALLSFSVHGQTTTGFYLGGELGSYSVEDETDETADFFVDELGGSVKVTQDASGGTIKSFAGYAFTPGFALEAGFLSGSDSIEAKGTTGGGDSYKVTGTRAWRGLEIAAILRPSLFSEDVSPRLNGLFLKAGMNSIKSEIETEFEGSIWTTDKTTESETRTGTSLGLGYDLGLGQSQKHNLRFAFTSINNKAVDEDGAYSIFSVGYFYRF